VKQPAAVCISNLHNIGLLVMMYANDQNQQLPWYLGYAQYDSRDWNTCQRIYPTLTEWAGVLVGSQGYFEGVKMFLCPSASNVSDAGWWGINMENSQIKYSDNNQYGWTYDCTYVLLTNNPMVTEQYGEVISTTNMPGDSVIGGDRMIAWSSRGVLPAYDVFLHGDPVYPWEPKYHLWGPRDGNHTNYRFKGYPWDIGYSGYIIGDVMNTLFLGGDVRTRKAGYLKYGVDMTTTGNTQMY